MKEKFEIPEIPKEPEQKSEIKTESFHRVAKERQKLRREFWKRKVSNGARRKVKSLNRFLWMSKSVGLKRAVRRIF